MTKKRVLFWHRKDLRLEDNLGLYLASNRSPFLTGVYIFDPKVISPPSISPAKLWFLLESLKELKYNWQMSGSRLIIMSGNPVEIIPSLVYKLNIESIFYNLDIEPYGLDRDRCVSSAVKRHGCKVFDYWDHVLVDPTKLKTGAGEPYRVYSPFLRNWKNKVYDKKIVSVESPRELVDFDDKQIVEDVKETSLDFLLKTHGFNGIGMCPCKPGEINARKQLKTFCENSITGYESNRNFPGISGTSYLGAALSLGTLSPRQAWTAAQDVKMTTVNEMAIKSISIWEQELAWREFYQQALFHFPELADGPYRQNWKNFPWQNNKNFFESWCKGLTGFPIIDAAMRQLLQSGWMHNRCRMIVASFLVKDLICDWRWGEAYFLQLLVDGDLAANNGGWQWSSSSGMDPKPLRIFNPTLQAQKFDPKGEYIRQWLPEISHLNTSELVSGNILNPLREGYVEKIVDHKKQQNYFKELYATTRS